MTDQTPSTEDVERARFNVSGVHHIIGTECLCGARRLHKNRDRTEHILDAFIKELDLVAHDRAVKAEALREAAVDGHRAFTEWVAQTPARNFLRGMSAVLTQDLHAMADRIEAGRD